MRHFIHEPTPAQAACHAPKPILLDTGSLAIPYAWRAPAPYTLVQSLGLCLPILLDTGSLAIPCAWRAPAPKPLPWSSPWGFACFQRAGGLPS